MYAGKINIIYYLCDIIVLKIITKYYIKSKITKHNI